jgi:hypothetical protein
MTKDNLPKAQDGTSIPLSSTPKLDEAFMERKYGSYPGPRPVEPIPYMNTGSIPTVSSGNQPSSLLADLLKFSSGKDESKGGRTRTLSEFAENRNNRYDFFMPGKFDNEDAYGQQQSFGSKMVNGVGKGLLLTGTTFLQSTVGLVNGTIKAIGDGKFSSFYDNEFNNKLDEINKAAEDALPNYYTAVERDANWYSPKYWMTGNFLWDGVVKNLGFAAGASLSGGVYTQALKSLPYASRLFSVGKSAETLAATEAGLLGANKVADTYGKVRALSDKFLSNYNTLNPAGRIVVAGLATTGEAGIEALHSSNEFRKELIDAHIAKFGVEPTGIVLEEINDAAEGAGNATFFANVGLLTATNYIQFPKILGSTYKAEKGIIDGLVRETDDIILEGGKYVKPTSKYPKISALNKIRPYTFSTSEAFEEVSQYSATVATQDYYNKKRNGEATSWLDSAIVGITEGAFTEEGAKNALIGGISGALMQGRGRFIQDRAKRKNTASLVETLNNTKLSDFTKETIDALNRGTVLQQEREQAVKNGDVLNSKDLEADYIINYLTPRIKYGRYDLVKTDIDEYKKLASTDTGFAQLQAEGKALETDTRQAYIERLNRFDQTADNVKSLWQSLNLRYSGQIDENGKPIYSNDIINKMIYAATKVGDYDQRIPELSAPLMAIGINTQDVIQSLINGDTEAFNEAVNTIKNLDIISERKDQLGEQLDDLAEISLRRQDFLKAYTNIKENPNRYKEAPIKTEQSVESTKTVKVKTKKGEVDIEIGTVYFAGKGIDYSKDPINSPVPISQFVVEEINEDGTLKIRNTDTDIVKDIKVEEFENLKVGKYDTLKENKTANYFYNHRNDIFEFNFGKNFGGKKQGRLEYQDGKLYFVYITPKGKVSKKELNNSHFITQEGFNKPIISKVGTVENEQQKESRESFLSPEEIAIQKTTLAKNRESRLEVLSQLGEEAKENLSEIEKKLAKQNEELAKIKEDFQNIEKMKKEGSTGIKIKLNFSKATRSFTQALNKLTKMQSDIETEIENLNSQKEELEMNISYFQDFTNQITEMPEDSGQFLRELKDQVALLVDNGKNLNNALAAAKQMVKSVNKAIKAAAGLFRKTLKSTYIVDEDYSQYLSDLLDQAVSGENIEVTWPLLKQEMANFALTSDLSKEATVDEPTLLKSIEEVKQIEKDLAELRAEYKSRKIILDRFQNIMNEYNANKEQQEKLAERFNKLSNTEYKGPAINSFDTSYEAESKKSNEIIYRATTERYEGKPHQIRSNQFGLDLDKFKNRDSIRGIFVTSKTQDQLLPGVIELMLDNDPTLIAKYKDSMIVMVMVDESGSVVGVDGKPIPEGKDLLENAIFQAMPESGFRDGKMFRQDTSEEVKDAINKQYNKIRSEILNQTILGVPQEIEASFGVPQFEKDAAGNKIYTTRTSVQAAGLVNESDLEEELVLFVPTTNKNDKNVSKGTVTYTSPLGSVFLDLPNGRLKLKNRIHTRKESTAIFDSILQLSKNIINSEEEITSDSSVRILEFLKGVTYWGLPVNKAGNNSVFFKNVKVEDGSAISFSKNMLVIGSEEISFGFTPTELQASKELIISELEKIYNNVNAFKTKDIDRSFEQITSISPDGEIESIIWPNYQSYLLSDKKPNGSKREDFELPLFTLMKPKVEGEFNREGIYFYTTNTADNFEIPQPKSQTSNIPIQQKVDYIIDGKTVNTYTSPQGKKILFRALPNTTKDNYETNIQVLPGGDLNELIEVFEKAQKDYKTQIKQTLFNAISPQLIKNKAEEEYEMKFTIPSDEEPTEVKSLSNQPTKQSSEIDAKKADIERRNKNLPIINVYWGSAETPTNTRLLSNLAPRKFTYQGKEYGSVEHAYQTLKSGQFDQVTYDKYVKAGGYGTKIRGKAVTQGFDNLQLMKDLVVASFKQNPEQAKLLLKYKDFTHTTNEIIDKAFLKGLKLAKYDAELAALEGETRMKNVGLAKQEAETREKKGLSGLKSGVEDNDAQSLIDSLEDEINKAIADINSEDLRVKINEELSRFAPENWNKVESWLKQNFPNLPVYRVKNIIQATNGRQAWGMFKDGAIYIYKNAETGTAYHEVFEAVWKMFTSSEEQVDIINEFKARKGTFVDRPTGKTVKYSEATSSQIKEELAEEFRDFIEKKSKPEGLKSKIGKLFRDLKRFIENALLGTNSQKFTNELFERIGNGYYKKHMPYATQLSMAQKGIIDIEDAFATSDSEFRLKTLSDRQTSDTIQEMTFLMLSNLVKDDRNLFEIADKINQKDFYKDLLPKVLATVRNKEIVINTIIKNNPNISKEQEDALAIIIANNRQLERDIVSDWSRITEKHKEYIKAYNITFDENDELQLTDEDKIKESNKFDASKIDSFRKANTAIKLLLATNPIMDNNGKAVLSTINGRLLNPVSKMYITLMNNLHSSTSMEDMINRLQKMAIEDPTYEMLFKRITKKTAITGDVNFSQIKSTHSAQLLSGLWKTFKKQSPDVKNVFIFNDGDVVVGDATLSSSASQLRNEYIRSIALKAKAGKGYFSYDDKKNAYIPNRKKLADTELTNLKERLDFLSALGIPFNSNEYDKLSKSNKEQFVKTVDGIKKSIEDAEKIVSFSTKSLGVAGRLLEVGILKTAASNPEFSSTYFNISGERVQNFIGTNAASDLHNILSNIENINDLAGTQYAYLLTDVFSKNSNLLSRMFKEDGTKKSNANKLFKPGYSGGIINEEKGKSTPSSNLSQKQRLVQELNLNIEGQYLNLVPGDASLEHMLYMGNPISANSLSRGLVDVNQIFKGYFLSELELSRENRKVTEGRNNKDLRFFKGILGEELHNEVITTEGSPEEVYNIFENKINQAISNYIKSDILRIQSYLDRFNILKVEDQNKFTLEGVGLPIQMSASELNRELTALSVNYMIANIEMHKLLYSDPYQYKDELKRIKSFLSPRQPIISNSPAMNVLLNKVWNEGFEKDDVGHTNFTQDYMRTASHEDIVGVIDLPNYENYEETDGGGIISYKSYRNFRIRASDWNENEEKQFRYDIAYEKRDKGLTLSSSELALLKEGNPQIKSAYTPLKPIVSGTKLDINGNPSLYNDVVLDKYALYPLSYRVMKEINAEANTIKLYNKMQSENIDYIVFESGRKVGAEKSHPTYNEDGSFNNNKYESIVNVPLSIMSVQSEVPSKETALVTRGSQVTKLITMDYLDNGVPIDFMNDVQVVYAKREVDGNNVFLKVIGDKKTIIPESEIPKGISVIDEADIKRRSSRVNFNQRYEAWNKLSEKEKLDKSPLYKEIVNNQKLLQELTNEGFETILRKLGIVEEDGKFIVKDFSEATKTLRDEMFKREINDNISDALSAFLEGESIIEATPAYQTIRNVLYSIVDKEIVSPKISGGMKVQIPSSLFESTRTKITEINGKKGYTSDILKFYEDKDGKRVMEVMVGRWFKSNMSDKDLLKYLNETPDGQKILSGMAFRIPTQSQNSIDAIRIKQFLPKEFGDSVVVPAAIVKKVGSDFDIDKLSMYFKNVYYENDKIKLVPFYGFGKQAKDKFAAMFDSGVLFNKEQRKQLDDLKKLKEYEISGIFNTTEGKRFDSLLESLGIANDEDALSTLLSELQELGVKDAIVNKLYKQSLENEFIQSSENLISNPLNFEKLITPNSADQLKGISKTIVERVIGSSFDYTNVNNMLDRRYMSRLRNAFVSGKRAIGIAAVNQTNQSLNQRTTIILDKNRMDRVEESKWLGDGEIKFENYNKVVIDGQEYPTLSGVTNTEGQRITNILGQFIDGYVDISKDPWIMEMGATPNVASTFMFLAKLGIPIDTVAYFMNQPMIREYLQLIENEGYSFLFIEDYVDNIKSEYLKTQDVASYIKNKKDNNKWPTKIPNKSTLINSLGKTEFTQEERDEQVFMFDEFLKYVKMANELYTVTQGSNWDTSNFNDSFLVYKKNKQYEQAKNTMLASYDSETNTLISAVDGLLKNSFIGNLAEKINDSKDALSNFLISDKGNVQAVLNKVLDPYVSLPNRSFVKVARKAVNDLFDWAVQTDQGLNLQLQETLLSNDGVASEVLSFIDDVKKDPKNSLFNNQIINIIEVRPSLKEGEKTPNNLSLKNKDNRVYDQNNIIYAFRELKEALKDKSDLYDKIVTLSILQSGLNNSPISFTSLIPYEDFAKIYNKTLLRIENIPNLNDFYELGIFQRNNWSDDDIVPQIKLFSMFSPEKGIEYPYVDFLPNNVTKAINNNEIPQVIKQRTGSRRGNDEYIVASWNKKLSQTEIAKMRKQGDYSYINKGLFKKVYDADGDPLINTDNKKNTYFVYKAINAWGDSFRANEFYAEAKQSIIDNGIMKVNEVIDAQVVASFQNNVKVTRTPSTDASSGALFTKKGNEYTLADGKTYTEDDINSEMLIAMGYSEQRAGQIINIKCKG